MTLSKYERRVLEEIEADFRAVRSPWWKLPWLRATLCVLAGLGACVILALFVPSPAAALATAAVGALTGCAAMTVGRPR
jgi:hypothetical protein